MKPETKRIFISDLPENISESDLQEKFADYGEVTSIEVKQRKELGPKNRFLKFAFVSLTTDHSSLQRCFEDFANEKWKGEYVEVQLAKESFLSRLKKEREEATANVECNGLPNNSIRQSELNETDTVVRNNQHNIITSQKLKVETVRNDPIIKVEKQFNQRRPEINLKRQSKLSETDTLIRNNQRNIITSQKLKIESVGNAPIIKIENPKPKSMDPKRAEADLKRIQSMIEMKKGYNQQKLLIKTALSKIDVKSTNKIIFNNEQNESGTVSDENTSTHKGKSLFDDDEDDNKEYNFEVKDQFQGKKGRKLLELQSKYKQDERFTLNEKFLEDDDGNDDRVEEEQPQDAVRNEANEQKQQIMILEEVLGQKIGNLEDNNSNKKKRKAMLRFDPTQPDHVKYEMKTEEENLTKKRKKKTKGEKKEVITEENKPVVSKEKFYQVTDNLKDVFNEGKSFSLLDTFGKIQEKDTNAYCAEEEENKIPEASGTSIRKKPGEKNPFKYDSSDDESDNNNKEEDIGVVQKSPESNIKNNVDLGPSRLWTEPFFFKSDDHRFQEGIDFLRKLEITETSEFSKIRRDLVGIVRAKVKNNQRRNRPFKKKLGGRKMRKIKRALKR